MTIALHLHAASRVGDVCQIRQLAKAGANVECRDRHGNTPLLLASANGRDEAVSLLVSLGADINVSAKYRLTPIHLAILNNHASTALLLIKLGCSLNVVTGGSAAFSGMTPLNLAVHVGLDSVVNELLRKVSST